MKKYLTVFIGVTLKTNRRTNDVTFCWNLTAIANASYKNRGRGELSCSFALHGGENLDIFVIIRFIGFACRAIESEREGERFINWGLK